MLWSCLKRRKNTKSKNPKFVSAKNMRIMLLSKFEVCETKRPGFSKEQEASALLSSLEIKTSLSKISLVDPLLL